MFMWEGIANVVMQVAAQAGCKCYGIEIRDDLHKFAQKIKDNFTRRMVRDNRQTGKVILLNVSFISLTLNHFPQGDALEDVYDYFLTKSTIVFMNNVCYDAMLEQGLMRKFYSCLRHGVRLITTKVSHCDCGKSHLPRSSFRVVYRL
jgi:hypothetical protein